jgi:tRNA(Ile)-lysidine synthase
MPDFHTQRLVHSVSASMSRFDIVPGAKIGVGVSGGPDSMVLLYILHHLGYHPVALHVNFNLRGADALNDARFVEKWAAEQGIPSFILDKDTKAYAKEFHLNTQTAAREIRYAWWEELIQHQEFNYVATAHHLDDATETVFLNLMRGTGIKGLRGIPAKRDYFIRPLLDGRRDEIIAFAAEFQIPYRTDDTNLTDAYQRNKIRHHLLPVAEEIQPGLHARLSHSIHRINVEWDAFHDAFEQWVQQHVSRQGDGFQIISSMQNPGFLLRWLEEKGIPWRLAHDFVMASEPLSGKPLEYETLRLSRTSNGLYLEEIIPKSTYTIPHEGQYAIGRYVLSIRRVDKVQFLLETNPFTVFVHPNVVKWPLHVRPIKQGDQFQPFGMKGQHKKLQDLMVDLKKDYHEKAHQLLLCNSDHILWVIGIRLDERARVNDGDDSIYKIDFTEP